MHAKYASGQVWWAVICLGLDQSSHQPNHMFDLAQLIVTKSMLHI